MGFFGMLFWIAVIWLAVKAFRSSGSQALVEPAPRLVRLYVLTLANPLTIVLFVAFADQMRTSGIADIAVDALCLFAGSLAVQAAYAGCGALLQRCLTDARAVRRFNVASSAAIALFGLYGLARAFP